MKVKIAYTVRTEKIVEMTPEEYCYLRADLANPEYYPLEARDKEIAPADDKAQSELYDYWDWRQRQIHGGK